MASFTFRAADLFKSTSAWHDLASDAWLVKHDNRDKKKQVKAKLEGAEGNDGEDDGAGQPEPIQDLTHAAAASTPAKVKPEPPRETPTKLCKVTPAFENVGTDKTTS